jgi:hypothetical protein
LAVDLGVMNDFAKKENAIVREDAACGVGEVDSAFDAIAEAEITGESYHGLADLYDATACTDGINERAAIMLFDLSLHAFHHLRSADVDAAFDGGGGGRGGRTHEGRHQKV